ncbi:hypothetical protein BDW74DRAFT_129455 [Aspergillus multicolor]|uniref:uncharacterized protein n=1 Tax=Aspergillus multicolor TaxID=41759 RepID=UPI003CCDB82B
MLTYFLFTEYFVGLLLSASGVYLHGHHAQLHSVSLLLILLWSLCPVYDLFLIIRLLYAIPSVFFFFFLFDSSLIFFLLSTFFLLSISMLIIGATGMALFCCYLRIVRLLFLSYRILMAPKSYA